MRLGLTLKKGLEDFVCDQHERLSGAGEQDPWLVRIDPKLAEELGIRPLQPHCHLGLGTLYAQTRRVEQAHVGLSAATTLYRAMEMGLWLPRTEAALAQVG